MSYSRYINDLADLTTLTIRQDDVNFGHIKNYASYCKKLEKITFEGCGNVHHSSISDLFRNNRLINEIVFVDCTRFGHDCFEHFRSIRSSLRTLDLTGYNLSENEQSSILRVGLDNLQTITFGYPFRHIHLFNQYYPRCRVVFKTRSDLVPGPEIEMRRQQALDQKARSKRSRVKKQQTANELQLENLSLDGSRPSSSSQAGASSSRDRSDKKLRVNYDKEIRRLRRSRVKQELLDDSSDSSSFSSDTSSSPYNKSTSSSSSSSNAGAASRHRKPIWKIVRSPSPRQ